MNARLGGGLLLLLALAAVLGPWLSPHAPDAQDLDRVLAPISAAHPLGTDENGVDLLAMLLSGLRLSLLIAGGAVAVSFAIGSALGALAGYRGGWIDEAIMRVCDVLLSFPGILLNLTIVALVARPSPVFMAGALCVNGWVSYARVARAQTLVVRERGYVQNARATGAGTPRILFRHILPSILGPLVVLATFGLGGAILVEASLSFLGLGPARPYSLGALLAQGTTYLWRSTHLAAVPGVAIALAVLGCNLLGDALRDRLDPRGGITSRP